MRCPDCSKFTSLEPNEPEAEVEVTNDLGNAKVSGSVRVVLACADCSFELKESSFDVDLTIPLAHVGECAGDRELDLDFSPLSFDEFVPPGAKRQKHMYGAGGTITVSCECGAEGVVEWHDSIQSSHMDEMT